MEQKVCRVQVKAGAEGVVSGWASRYEKTPDRSGDIVAPGAYARTLRENGGIVPVLFSHSAQRPIGVGRLTDRPEGLWIDARLNLDVPDGAAAWSLAKSGAMPAFSIGYDTRKSRRVAVGRELQDIALFEVSLVSIPAEPRAVIESVKGLHGADIAKQIQGLARKARVMAQRSRQDAINRRLDQMLGGLDRLRGRL